MREAPSFKGASLVSATPHRDAIEGRVLVTVGVGSPGAVAVLPIGDRLLLWVHRTQPGTLDGYCRDFRLR